MNIYLPWVFVVGLGLITGCCTNDPLLDGRSSTSSVKNTTVCSNDMKYRSFPANRDELQVCRFSENESIRIEYYPDGMPYRIIPYGCELSSSSGFSLEKSENMCVNFDFDGKILSKDSIPKKGSQYWDKGWLRVRLAYGTTLNTDYYLACYYYQSKDDELKIAVWTIDRKKKLMDKFVFNVGLEAGRVKGEPKIESHLGSLTTLEKVIDSEKSISVELKLHINGKDVLTKCEILSLPRDSKNRKFLIERPIL